MASNKKHSNGKVRKADAPRGAAAAAPGARLAAAFEAVEKFPALIESRARVMQAATAETSRIGELVAAVEADVALTIAVLRFANRSSSSGSIGGVPAAVDVLKPSGVLAIASTPEGFSTSTAAGTPPMLPELLERLAKRSTAIVRATSASTAATSSPTREVSAVAACITRARDSIRAGNFSTASKAAARRAPGAAAAAPRGASALRTLPLLCFLFDAIAVSLRPPHRQQRTHGLAFASPLLGVVMRGGVRGPCRCAAATHHGPAQRATRRSRARRCRR